MTPTVRLSIVVVVLSSVAVLRFGALGMMDAPFALMLSGAAWTAARASSRVALPLAAVLVAMATLLKGPVGALLGVGFVVIAAWQHGRRFGAPSILGSLVVLGLFVLPW